MNANLQMLGPVGMNIRKYRLRLAVNEDRARAWASAAIKDGCTEQECADALGMTLEQCRQLRGTA